MASTKRVGLSAFSNCTSDNQEEAKAIFQSLELSIAPSRKDYVKELVEAKLYWRKEIQCPTVPYPSQKRIKFPNYERNSLPLYPCGVPPEKG
jgi:hypothetical protein